MTPVPLPARLDVGRLASDAVAAASHAAAALVGAEHRNVDPVRVAAAYTSDRHLRIDGHPAQAFAPLSGFFASADGWVRTHANYPWHLEALLRVLGRDDEDRAEAADVIRTRSAREVARAVTDAGGLAVVVAKADQPTMARLQTEPLVRVAPLGTGSRAAPSGSARAPLMGVRVLDLTRVIAGPVATRTLALLGADVLRIDPPGRPEIPWQHLDTGHGKRSAVLDVSDPLLRELARTADVIVTGYRRGSLEARGFDPVAIAAEGRGMVVARLSAWGDERRGFDSLVQASDGIAMIESDDGMTPGALPAQALDHSAGYRLAEAVLRALARRADGGVLIETSLVRMAAELLRLGDGPAVGPADPSAIETQEVTVGASTVRTVVPAIAYDGAPDRFAPPRPWGADEPAWL
ncbi:CoA transferase [Microbacterium gorillae]|uniref:CoA transferase n=1 Tax=Microbacterium gorillae TaxID=1231063 RepID=UPI00058E6622|nr:CoA transferase [Microbacterium gorillae]